MICLFHSILQGVPLPEPVPNDTLGHPSWKEATGGL